MALKEGRCPNCGSIIMLDETQEKGHCLYCDAVFETPKALDLASDASNWTFPHAEQPKYEGPSLDPAQLRADISREPKPLRPAELQAEKGAETVESYVPSVTKVPSLNLQPRQILVLSLAFLLCVAVFVALVFPITRKRDRHRAAIASAFEDLAETRLTLNESLDLRLLNNSQMLLMSKETVSEEKAVKLYLDFRKARDSVLYPNGPAGQDELTLRIASPEKAYQLRGRDAQPEITEWKEEK